MRTDRRRAALGARLALRLRGRRRAVAFHLPTTGELQFFEDVLLAYCEAHPEDVVVLVHHGDTEEWFASQHPSLAARILHLSEQRVRKWRAPGLDLFLTCSQWSLGLPGVYSVATFHGQPSKGLTFSDGIVEGFDAFFLYGPLQRQALDEFLAAHPEARASHLRLFEVGYPKSDAVVSGRIDRGLVAELALDPAKPTVLYAPAFNDGASMREAGPEIIRALAGSGAYNVIAKLAVDCMRATTDLEGTGGTDWFARFGGLERELPNFRLLRDDRVDRALAAADVLVTCVSSVSFEFLALGKPVVFVDTPAFYARLLGGLFPGEDTIAWAERTTVNAGREFGTVVAAVADLPQAVADVLAHPEEYPRQRERLRTYLLYHPGEATRVAIAAIEELLAERPAPSKPLRPPAAVRAFLADPATRALKGFLRPAYHAAVRAANARGLAISRTGEAYIPAVATVAAAAAAGLSICEYLESREPDRRKRGRRDRIVAEMERRGLLDRCDTVAEIGAGTGMYLEKVVERARPRRYEVFETDSGWMAFLKERYDGVPGCTLVVHAADGETLRQTPAASCDLVHAHATFVYIPVLKTLSYLREAARVLKPGGHLVGDVLLDTAFDPVMAERWLRGPWRFPVVVPEALLLHWAEANALRLVDRFTEVYGSSASEYLVFRKAAAEPN